MYAYERTSQLTYENVKAHSHQARLRPRSKSNRARLRQLTDVKTRLV